MDDLKQQLIDLGREHTDLREHLREILDFITGKKEEPKVLEAPEKPDENVKEKEKDKQIFSRSPHAMSAFNEVILPQIQTQADAFSFEDLAKMMSEIETLGRSKNVELETALIVHKPVSMDTSRFYKEIQDVFNDWIRPKLKGEGGEGSNENPEGSSGSGEEKKEYNFNFS